MTSLLRKALSPTTHRERHEMASLPQRSPSISNILLFSNIMLNKIAHQGLTLPHFHAKREMCCTEIHILIAHSTTGEICPWVL